MSSSRSGWSGILRSSVRAASHLSEDLRVRYSDVPWRSIIGMRHFLVHGYFEVDLDLVWLVVENELDKLKSAVRPAIADRSAG